MTLHQWLFLSVLVTLFVGLLIKRRTKVRFLIMKSSRARDDFDVTLRNAYANPQTCKKAGVIPGKIYRSRKKAEADAAKLGGVNPVRFTVVQLEAGE